MRLISVDVQLCDGCGICIEECPMGVFKLDASTNKAIVVNALDCNQHTRCPIYFCEATCPPKAIQVSRGRERSPFRPY
ncbi:MAG: 4Fe-4S binding protein [Chloroflexi bacterium]|nr:4Fe-4S binding protein [Chloroflexota bacterium]